MRWQVGRFVRGTIDEDVSENPIDTDAVFDRDRLAAALAELMERNQARRAPGWHEVDQGNWEA